MSRKPVSVRQLANEAGVGIDEALVTLWDLGANHVLSPTELVPRGVLASARRALGVAGRDELRTLTYWILLLAIPQTELRLLLANAGIPMGTKARKLPPGGVSRLKAIARSKGIDPLTGVIAARPATMQQPRVSSEEMAAPSAARSAVRAFEWRPPGHRRDLRWLSDEEVKRIHWALVDDFAQSEDPINPPGVRSEDLLGSAVFRPQTSIGDVLKYPTVEAAAAALLHALVLDHPFINGNKRTALVAMLVFLDENRVVLACDENDLFRLVLQVAQHRVAPLAGEEMADREVHAVASWLCDGRTRLAFKGEHPLPWRRLRGILEAYGCECEFAGGVGNRRDIRRTIDAPRGIFGQRRQQLLQTQVHCRAEASEASVDVIKKIREDLQLDDDHGVDSLDFYSKEPAAIPDFIAKYRKTLYRLAKL